MWLVPGITTVSELEDLSFSRNRYPLYGKRNWDYRLRKLGHSLTECASGVRLDKHLKSVRKSGSKSGYTGGVREKKEQKLPS